MNQFLFLRQRIISHEYAAQIYAQIAVSSQRRGEIICKYGHGKYKDSLSLFHIKITFYQQKYSQTPDCQAKQGSYQNLSGQQQGNGDGFSFHH